MCCLKTSVSVAPPDLIEIVRNEVKLEEQAAKSEVIEIPVEGSEGAVVKIGVIDLPVFYMDFAGRAENKPDYRSSTRDVRRLIGELEEQGVAGIIVDLQEQRRWFAAGSNDADRLVYRHRPGGAGAQFQRPDLARRRRRSGHGLGRSTGSTGESLQCIRL